MGSQFIVYLYDEDYQRVGQALQDLGPLKIFPGSFPGPGAQSLPDFQIPSMGETPLTVFFTREPWDQSLVLETLEAGGPLFLDGHRSPVIEFFRCYAEGPLLRSGRFFFDSSYWDNSETIRKSLEFINWAKKVFQTVKKVLVYDPRTGAYWGPQALQVYGKDQEFSSGKTPG